MKMTEDDFAKMVEGKNLTDAEMALLRRDCSLPYDETALKPHLGAPVLERRLTLIVYSKLGTSSQSATDASMSKDDTFMSDVAQFFKGEGKEADELIEEVARRLLKINTTNPNVVKQVVAQVYGPMPTPPDFSKRLLTKLQALHQRQAP